MAGLDAEQVRHALKTAQEHNFAEVEIEADGSSFRAKLEPGKRKPTKRVTPEFKPEASPDADYLVIRSPLVGYYRVGPMALVAGKNVQKGDVVATINALGISNDVESQVSGEITEVTVNDGQAVEFGQVLAKVKP
jgi:biotin carboxyl carrier protein